MSEIMCDCGHTINEHTSGCMWSHYTVDASANSPLACSCKLTPQDIAAARLAAAESAQKALRDLVVELNEHHTIRDLHIDVVSAVTAANRVLDAALLRQPAKNGS